MNQIFTGPNALPSSTPQALQHCNLHGHGADSVAAPAFRFSGQRIDWRTLHGVDFDTLVSAALLYRPPAACIGSGS